MSGTIGYIGWDNKLHLNGGVNPAEYQDFLIGNSGITVGQALAGQDLSSWNKPLSTSWSWSNVVKNLPTEIDNLFSGVDQTITKYAVLAIVGIVAFGMVKK